MAQTTLSLPMPAVAVPRRRWRVRWAAWSLLAPSLVFLIGFTYWPVAQVIWRSLVVHRFGATPFFGFGNYARLVADPHFAQAALNNTLYALGSIVPSLMLALAFAIVLKEHTRFTATLRTLFVLPMMVPLVAAAALFTFIFQPGTGLLDWYLGQFGWPATNWIGDPSLALASITGITIWKDTGYYMLFFLAGLSGIPPELDEAARLDGATAWQRFRRITLPLLGPTTAFVLVVALLNAMTQVDHVIVMTQGGPSGSTNLLLYYIYQQAHQNYDLGLAAAATVVSVGVLFVLALASLRTLERGVHYEA